MKIICLVGYPGVGKTTVGKALAEKLRYHHIEVHDLVEKISKNKGLDIIKDVRLLDLIKSELTERCIITGIREPYIIEHLVKRFNAKVVKLKRKNRPDTEDIKKRTEHSIEMGVDKIYPDYFITNDDSIQDVVTKIQRFVV